MDSKQLLYKKAISDFCNLLTVDDKILHLFPENLNYLDYCEKFGFEITYIGDKSKIGSSYRCISDQTDNVLIPYKSLNGIWTVDFFRYKNILQITIRKNIKLGMLMVIKLLVFMLTPWIDKWRL